MPNYKRVYVKGGTYFFTVVTCNRVPVFQSEASISLLETCFQKIAANYPFDIDSIVILPDHIHTIWSLPEGDSDYSTRWRLIKKRFPLHYSHGNIWQKRFWEHLIRDDEDLSRHHDYIHYNPVKHSLINSPASWKYSSFQDFVDNDYYSQDWGITEPEHLSEMNYE